MSIGKLNLRKINNKALTIGAGMMGGQFAAGFLCRAVNKAIDKNGNYTNNKAP